MATPNVLVRIKYYEAGSSDRSFYASGKKDDYVGYVDKGIKSDKTQDYMDYTGNPEKSSGVFSKNGILSAEDKKALRKELRETKSCIWDCVISFEEKYGKKNVYDWKQAYEILCKTLPSYFKSVGLDPDKTAWYAGLHTNTDNRHIHLSFFQREPTVYDKKAKAYRFRKGKMPMDKTARFKMAIEQRFLSPVEGMKRVRLLLVDEARKAVSDSVSANSHSTRILLRNLYESIPEQGDLGYESKNMDGCRETVDAITRIVLSDETLQKEYGAIDEQLKKRDEEIAKICTDQKIANFEPFLYRPKFEKDLYRRMGNAIIRGVVKKRNDEKNAERRCHHPKSRQRNHLDHILSLMCNAAWITQEAEEEAIDEFVDYEETLKKAEHDRLVEEGEIEAE
jgi:hypothetical protein